MHQGFGERTLVLITTYECPGRQSLLLPTYTVPLAYPEDREEGIQGRILEIQGFHEEDESFHILFDYSISFVSHGTITRHLNAWAHTIGGGSLARVW